jgi:prophage regulatory protein
LLSRLLRLLPCAHPHCGHRHSTLAGVMTRVFQHLPMGTAWCDRLPTSCTASRHFSARFRIPAKARRFSTATVTAGLPSLREHTPMKNGTTSTPVILRRPQVEARTGLSRSTLYQYIQDGLFPRPVSLGARAVGWLESEVTAWIAARAKAVRPGTAPGR